VAETCVFCKKTCVSKLIVVAKTFEVWQKTLWSYSEYYIFRIRRTLQNTSI